MTTPHHVGPSRASADQSDAWNGPEGANWAKHTARRVTGGDLVDPLLDAAAVTPTTRVLDIGCGTGALTRRAAQQATRGRVLGIDLSATMVEDARRQAAAEGIANATFEAADAQVHRFEASSFDVALSHFGAMFFADPVAAFRNIAGAVRPGGQVLFVCPQSMDRCDWYNVPLAALLGEAPTETTAPSAMFSLADPAVVHHILQAAGLHGVSVRPLEQTLWFGDDVATAVDSFFGSGPVRAVRERTTLTTDDVTERLTTALAPYLTDAGVRLPGAYWLVAADR